MPSAPGVDAHPEACERPSRGMSTAASPRRSRPRGGLRPEDAGLLRRIESELAFEAAFGPSALPALPRRASGSVELLRDAEGGERLIADALAGHADALRAALLPVDPRGLPAAQVHHAAVLAEHALEAALARTPGTPLTVAGALERMTMAWLELGRDGAYLVALATRAAGSLASSVRADVLHDLALRGITRAAELARAGLAERSADGRAAVHALRSVAMWLERLQLPDALTQRGLAASRAAVDALATSWLVRFREALDELLAREWAAEDAIRVLSDAASAWEWLECEPEIERHVLTALPDLAWPLYRKRAMREVGALLTPVMPLAWALERRVLEARAEARLDRDLPYVAPCAQALVFWAEVPREVEVGLERIERAYALCPTLRNARIVLAHLLCDRADHTLSRRELFPAHPPRADVERAARIFPELSRLAELQRRVGITP